MRDNTERPARFRSTHSRFYHCPLSKPSNHPTLDAQQGLLAKNELVSESRCQMPQSPNYLAKLFARPVNQFSELSQKNHHHHHHHRERKHLETTISYACRRLYTSTSLIKFPDCLGNARSIQQESRCKHLALLQTRGKQRRGPASNNGRFRGLTHVAVRIEAHVG